MMTQSGDELDSLFNSSDIMPAETKNNNSSSVGSTIELSRKPSIQELVDRAVDLTQTQSAESLDNISECQPNTIVEFDNIENGIDSTMDDDLSVKNDLIKIDENVPSPRWGNSMTMIDNSKLLVYGGQGLDPKTNTLTTFSDLHVYDLNKKTWKKPVNCEGKGTF